jgi:TIR domain-containing protein
MSKVCFVISPMGSEDSPTRARADYVLDTYIGPACKAAEYDALRADRGVGQDIVKGTNTALQNAPLAVAYMGRPTAEPVPAPGEFPSCWNANVMIETGYRLASRLPLIFLCDQDSLHYLPLSLKARNVIGLPRPDPANPGWVDPQPQKTVDRLIRQIREEEQAIRLLDSVHPLAAINAGTSQAEKPDNLFYTAASAAANGLFFGNGLDRPLVGRRMDGFLEELQKRMHPAQWRAFERDQVEARIQLSQGQHAIAKVPIVFEEHAIPNYKHRAFLPIIVQDYRPQEGGLNWFNLRVLYLDVTTVTEKAKDEFDEEYYVCRLDHRSDRRLQPLKPHEPIRIFLSYRRENEAKARAVYNRLVDLKPYVAPFIDTSMTASVNWLCTLEQRFQDSELCFLFLDGNDMGRGQKREVDAILTRLFAGEYPVVPVLLSPQSEMSIFLAATQWIDFEHLSVRKLQQILWHSFPRRCPPDWASEDEEPLEDEQRSRREETLEDELGPRP